MSTVIATSGSATLFLDPKAAAFFAIGKNPDKMFALGSSTLATEEGFQAHDPHVTQVSISSYHTLILYNERQLSGCPASRHELFAPWVEGSETEFCNVRLGEELDKIYKVHALDCGTIILCMSKISGQRELYSFGLPGSPALGQGEHQLMDEYARLEYPE